MESTGERVAEYEEIIGYHLEQAFGFRMELGPLNDVAAEVRARAAQPTRLCGERRCTAATCRRRSTSSSAQRRSPRESPTTPRCSSASAAC